MNKPHKHAAIIKAWADGEQIQFLMGDNWIDTEHPAWTESTEYRVKPEPVKLSYRVALFNDTLGPHTATINQKYRTGVIEQHNSFVRWLTDWVEVEI